MVAPSADRWATRPGGWDPLQARRLYRGDPAHGIPELLPVELPATLPTRFTPWPARKHAAAGNGLHFFVDDYRFEPLWRSPRRYAAVLERAPLVLGPDFSVYADWPRAMALWNVYRARWLCRELQDMDVAVVPSVTWGSPDTFDFAFLGLPSGTPVAVTSVGRARALEAYDQGYRAMVAAVAPRRVFVCGPRLSPELEALAAVVHVPSEALGRLRRIERWAVEGAAPAGVEAAAPAGPRSAASSPAA